MRLRNEERTAVLAMLDTEYSSPEDAADAVFNGVQKLLEERDSHGVRVRVGDTLDVAVGPFYGLTEARKAVKELGGMATIAPMASPGGFFKKLEEMDLDRRYCDVCEHPRFAHLQAGKFNGCIAGRLTDKKGKETQAGCGCTAVTAKASKKR